VSGIPPPALGESVALLAPSFALPDADGRLVRLEDLRGRAVLVVFLRHLA
jgi:peroxiredoxin